MKLETFFEKFDQFADAPEAVEKMRELVLEFAVQGKLVPQNTKDESADKLLNHIRAEKEELITAGKIKRQRSNGTEGELGCDSAVPRGWVLTTLGEVAQKITDGTHRTPVYVTEGVPFISVKDFSGGKLDFSSTRFITSDEHVQIYKRCDPRRGDILLGRIGTLGKAVLVDTDIEFSLFVSVALIRFSHRFIEPAFFRLLLNSPHTKLEFDRIKIGGATHTNKLNLGDLHTISVPFPPLAEQKRIVAKVDELMALCDRLEAQQLERETRHAALARASLARFADAPTPDNLDFLFHNSYTIAPADLRKAIFTLAVQGKLVPQDPNDEPADELLHKISAEQDELVKARQIRRVQTAPLAEGDEPFVIPSTWAWTRLGQIGDWGSGSTPPRGDHELYGGSTFWLKSGELNDNLALASSEETVTEIALKTCSFRLNKPGDVLLAMYGATIGKSAILAEAAVTNQAVCGCTPFAGVLNTYLFYYLLSQRDNFHAAGEGGAQPNISKIKIVSFPFPLPPLAEQRRIVAKVEQLMALVDELETQLVASRRTGANLLEAAVAELTAKA